MDIILVIVAWQKGWGWKALIPSFLTGFAVFSGVVALQVIGRNPLDYWWAFGVIGVFYIGTLIYMVSKPVGMGKLPSYKAIKKLGEDNGPKRAISSYGG